MEEITFFIEPDKIGWVYPTTIDKIEGVIRLLPKEDTEGLIGVGLVQSTKKNDYLDGSYTFSPKPTIRIYSYRADYKYKLPPSTKYKHVQHYFKTEISYGMTFECVGSRLVCCWDPKDLELFILRHLLLHEVGHHVFHLNRLQKNIIKFPDTRISEQFAEAYALKLSNLLFR